MRKRGFKGIAMGGSAGGFEAFAAIIPRLPLHFSLSVFVVQHMRYDSDDFLATHLNRISAVSVREAADKERIKPGEVYIAPAGYHLLVEEDKTLSLSVDPPVNFARPSIDVLFETAAEAYAETLIGVVLSGANSDGSLGLRQIKEHGGVTIVQDPATAKVAAMPNAALETAPVDYVLPLQEIGDFLCGFHGG